MISEPASSPTISGSGAVTQQGTGITVLTGNNSYGGSTAVDAGTLIVNRNQSAAAGATSVAAGATLGGAGTIAGDVSVADGATLSPGNLGSVPGTLRDLLYLCSDDKRLQSPPSVPSFAHDHGSTDLGARKGQLA